MCCPGVPWRWRRTHAMMHATLRSSEPWLSTKPVTTALYCSQDAEDDAAGRPRQPRFGEAGFRFHASIPQVWPVLVGKGWLSSFRAGQHRVSANALLASSGWASRYLNTFLPRQTLNLPLPHPSIHPRRLRSTMSRRHPASLRCRRRRRAARRATSTSSPRSSRCEGRGVVGDGGMLRD